MTTQNSPSPLFSMLWLAAVPGAYLVLRFTVVNYAALATRLPPAAGAKLRGVIALFGY